jgi:class 3 adenylate cyclase/GAF domain-containing protein
VAAHYLKDAHYAYELWGAAVRVDALVSRYPQLAVYRTRDLGPGTPLTTTGRSIGSLDSISVVKSSQAISSEIRLDRLLVNLMRIMLENAGAQRGALLLQKNGKWFIEAEGATDGSGIDVLHSLPLDGGDDSPRVPERMVHYVIRTRKDVVVERASAPSPFAADPYVIQYSPESMLCIPLLRQGQLAGVLYLENRITSNAFTPERIEVLNALSTQAAIAVENARLFTELRLLTDAQKRFVPYQFLEIMNRKDIGDVQVGDHVARTMSVLFCDLRRFTPLAERLPAKSTIELLNLYYQAMEAPIREHGGFIDAFTGDEIMVLFDGPADEAVSAACAMVDALEQLNQRLLVSHDLQLQMGIGINTGELLLGTVGGHERIKCGVVGDTVNLASRIESLTKQYRAKILIGERTYESLVNPERFRIRQLEMVRARGKTKEVMIFEVLVD